MMCLAYFPDDDDKLYIRLLGTRALSNGYVLTGPTVSHF